MWTTTDSHAVEAGHKSTNLAQGLQWRDAVRAETGTNCAKSKITPYQKRHCGAVDLRTGTAVQFGASFVALLPLAAATETMQVDYAPEFWLALGWSIFVLSLAAMLLLLVMIQRGRATRVASLMYLTPPATSLLAWLLFDERLGRIAWLGVAVAMFGVALVLREGKTA